jgi:asparagine synthase (glutamine-hydrolysing)
MCGIAGALRDLHPGMLAEIGARMAGSVRHRGPDRQAAWVGEGVVLAHARLSIIDLSDAGAQPMVSPCGRHVIAFNGEIYNFRELRGAMEADGETFRGHSDTEVLLRLLSRRGVEGLRQLDGIFAFAHWDIRARALTLVRDRFGAKPLYYSHQGDDLWFGSEVKALVAGDCPSFHPRLARLAEFMHYGTVGGSATMYDEVSRVPPGHALRFRRGAEPELLCYWRPEDVAPAALDDADAAREVRVRLEAAVRRQLVSDVPIGIFLSGGVDSSAIAAFAARHHPGRLRTYSVGFDFDRGVNELPRARRTAEGLGADHRELHVSSADLPAVIEALVGHHDEPFSDAANIPLYLLCRELRGSLKVVLQGDGGDEFFGGYRRHALFSRIRRWSWASRLALLSGPLLPPRHRRMAAALAAWDDGERMGRLLTEESDRPSPLRVLSPGLRSLAASQDPYANYRALDRRFAHLDPAQRMLFTDTQAVLTDTFLEKVDKSTMAWGIEARVPFLDSALTELALSLPAGQKVRAGRKKHLLRAALRGVVPDEVLDGPKTGFGVPYGHWLAGSLRDYARGVLLEEAAGPDPWLDAAAVGNLMDEVRDRRRGAFLAWKCLQLALWRRQAHLAR